MLASLSVVNDQKTYSGSVRIQGVEASGTLQVLSILDQFGKIERLPLVIFLRGSPVTDQVFNVSITFLRNSCSTATLELDGNVEVSIEDRVSIDAILEGAGSVRLFSGYADRIEINKAGRRKVAYFSDILYKLRDKTITGNLNSKGLKFKSSYVTYEYSLTPIFQYLLSPENISYVAPRDYTFCRDVSFVGSSKLKVLQDVCDELCLSFWIEPDNESLHVVLQETAPTVQLTADQYLNLVVSEERIGGRGVKAIAGKISTGLPESYYEHDEEDWVQIWGYREDGHWGIIEERSITNLGRWDIETINRVVDGAYRAVSQEWRQRKKINDVLIYSKTIHYDYLSPGDSWEEEGSYVYLFPRSACWVETKKVFSIGFVHRKTLQERWDSNFVLIERRERVEDLTEGSVVETIEKRRGHYWETISSDGTKTIQELQSPKEPSLLPFVEPEEQEIIEVWGLEDDAVEFTTRFLDNRSDVARYAQWKALTELRRKEATVTLAKFVPLRPGWFLVLEDEPDIKVFIDEIRINYRDSRVSMEVSGLSIPEVS